MIKSDEPYFIKQMEKERIQDRWELLQPKYKKISRWLKIYTPIELMPRQMKGFLAMRGYLVNQHNWYLGKKQSLHHKTNDLIIVEINWEKINTIVTLVDDI